MNQGARDAGKMSNLRRRRRTFSRSGPEHLKPSGPYGADSEQHREGPVGKTFFLFIMSPPRSDTGFRGSLDMGAHHFFCTRRWCLVRTPHITSDRMKRTQFFNTQLHKHSRVFCSTFFYFFQLQQLDHVVLIYHKRNVAIS